MPFACVWPPLTPPSRFWLPESGARVSGIARSGQPARSAFVTFQTVRQGSAPRARVRPLLLAGWLAAGRRLAIPGSAARLSPGQGPRGVALSPALKPWLLQEFPQPG